MKRVEQAADTRAALMEAAKRLFADRGYLNTKITDITAEAGRSAGSFYTHFTGKEELLEALLAQIAETGDGMAGTDEHKSDFTDPDAIRFHVRAYLRVYRAHAATMLALGQAALVDERFARTLDRFCRAQLDDMADHLDSVDGLPASREACLTILGAMFDSLPRLASALPEEEAVEAATRFLYRGLNGRDSPPRDAAGG